MQEGRWALDLAAVSCGGGKFSLALGACFEPDAVSVVNDAVEYGIGQGGVPDGLDASARGAVDG